MLLNTQTHRHVRARAMPTGAQLQCVPQQLPLFFELRSLQLPEDRHTTAGSTKHRGGRSEADRDTLLLQLQQNSLFFPAPRLLESNPFSLRARDEAGPLA